MIKYLKTVKRRIRRYLFDWELYSKLRGRKHLLVIGDSHVNVFKAIIKNRKASDFFWIDYLSVGGATAQGILNPGSKTDARRIFTDRISKSKTFQYILVELGEVDCGFVIWYYAEKYGTSVEEQLDRSVNNYLTFLKEIQACGIRNLHVLSAPLPTIRDGQDWGEIAKKRAEVTAKQTERTKLTVRFNEAMSMYCRDNGIGYLDQTHDMLNKDTWLIFDHLLHIDKNDHHLNDIEYSELIVKSLMTIR